MDLVMITSHQREKSMPNRIFSSVLLIIATLQLTGCAGAILGAGVAAIGASSSEKGFATTINDTSISLKIRDKFVQTDIDLVEGISIEVNDGNVLLVGRIENEELKVQASKLAWEVRGVRSVINDVEIAEKVSLKQRATDSSAGANLRRLLITDLNINSLNYSIDVVSGVVYLTGIAKDQAEIDRVTEHARNLSYVSRVENYVILQDDPRD